MFEAVRRRYHALRLRLQRLRRRELGALSQWLESTENLLHLSALLMVPVLIAAVTWVTNLSSIVTFLVYPPLAAGTYTLFADPGGRYSTPRRFVGGMTLGALCGWVALEVTARFIYGVPPSLFTVQAGSAAIGVFLTGVVTWLVDLENPAAYSSALLVLLTGSEELVYVGGLTVSCLIVAGVFVLWRRSFYRERARFLYQSTLGNDQVLVPVRGESVSPVALAARLAAAHDAGKVVLLETVPAEAIEAASRDEGGGPVALAGVSATSTSTVEDAGPTDPDAAAARAAEERVTARALERLEALQEQVAAVVDVPVEFLVAVETRDAGETVLDVARREGCDLVVVPAETQDGRPSRFVSTLLRGDVDAIVYRPLDEPTDWRRALVLVRSAGEVSNAMVDFARRLVGTDGTVSVCTCVTSRGARRSAEIMLESLVESFSGGVETRIADGPVEDFLAREAGAYDLAFVGASTDRSAASRFVSMPTFERIEALDCDLAVVHRG